MRVLVGGVHLGGDGYPNARNTLELLRQEPGVEVIECGRWLHPEHRLWRVAQAGVITRIKWSFELLVGNLVSLWRVCRIAHRDDWVYVPHPGLFFLWFASWMPRSRRPRCILDAYISVWDALHSDRDDRPGGRVLLRRIEARAWRAAERVIVDTIANRDYFIDAFRLDPARVNAWPLAIDEPVPIITPRSPGVVRILYVGTFVPLHGVEHLAKLAEAASSLPEVELLIVGDGQQAFLFERVAALTNARVRWIREWQSIEQVNAWIAQADICLGVFGGSGKASRVLPFKLYHYLAHGRPVISQAALSVPEGVPMPPIYAIEPTEPHALVDAVRKLVADTGSRRLLAEQSSDFYRLHLSNDAVRRRWLNLCSRTGAGRSSTVPRNN